LHWKVAPGGVLLKVNVAFAEFVDAGGPESMLVSGA
jgi:hypothetical protein